MLNGIMQWGVFHLRIHKKTHKGLYKLVASDMADHMHSMKTTVTTSLKTPTCYLGYTKPRPLFGQYIYR